MVLFLDFSQRTLTKKSVFHLLRSHLQAKNRPTATRSAFLLMTICDDNCKHTAKTRLTWSSQLWRLYNLHVKIKPEKVDSINSWLPLQSKCNQARPTKRITKKICSKILSCDHYTCMQAVNGLKLQIRLCSIIFSAWCDRNDL